MVKLTLLEAEDESSTILRKQYDPKKRRVLFTQRHRVTSKSLEYLILD
jgi:hypothetical protein